jgi:hypothetical protein
MTIPPRPCCFVNGREHPRVLKASKHPSFQGASSSIVLELQAPTVLTRQVVMMKAADTELACSPIDGAGHCNKSRLTLNAADPGTNQWKPGHETPAAQYWNTGTLEVWLRGLPSPFPVSGGMPRLVVLRSMGHFKVLTGGRQKWMGCTCTGCSLCTS